jgi:hypothetical protein
VYFVAMLRFACLVSVARVWTFCDYVRFVFLRVAGFMLCARLGLRSISCARTVVFVLFSRCVLGVGVIVIYVVLSILFWMLRSVFVKWLRYALSGIRLLASCPVNVDCSAELIVSDGEE